MQNPGDQEEGLRRYIAKAGLFGLLALIIIGAVAFVAIHGVLRANASPHTEQAVQALVLALGVLVGAVVVMLNKGNGGDD